MAWQDGIIYLAGSIYPPWPYTQGSKKVLAPTKHDEVFVYFADHGGPGILVGCCRLKPPP